MTNCRICHGETVLHFRGKVLNKHDAEYRYCPACDHVFAANPFWLKEAYSDAIVSTDTDIVVRNLLTALRLAAILYFAFDERGEGTYADVAGGYGLLTRLMRDLGFDYFWSDPYATNLVARGFEYTAAVGACSGISAVEVLEHTVDPLDFVRSNLATHGTDTMLLTTQLFTDSRPPLPGDWDYFSLETGQHIAFFSSKGIRLLGGRLGLTYYQLGRIHLLTRRNLSAARLKLASHRLLALPLALAAARRLGSKRGADRTKMSNLLRVPTEI